MTVASTSARPVSEWGVEAVDLSAYLSRVGNAGPLVPSAQTLRRLHREHISKISFENLDALLRRRISLDLLDVQDKLVRRQRGGYCHEQNLLFAAVLERLGFQVTRLLARVRHGAHTAMPLGHATLLAEVDAQIWLVDVGFGGDGLLEPIRFSSHGTTHQGGWSYRLRRDGDEWVLRTMRAKSWIDLYAFTPAVFRQPDFEMANHFVSTHPSSPFATDVIVQRSSEHARYALRGAELTVTRPDGSCHRRRLSAENLPRALRTTFGIHLTREEIRQLQSMVWPR